MTDHGSVALFSKTHRTPGPGEAQRLRDRYLKAIVTGDEHEAGDVIRQAVSHGWGPVTVYLDIMASAMVTVGDMWHSGEITVAHEHHATLLTTRLMALVKSEMSATVPTGLQAVVTAVERDGHLLGAMIFADFLSFDGWDVDLLGAGAPPEDLAKLVSEREPDLVALAVTLEEGIDIASECAKAVKSLDKPPKTVLGGAAVANYPEKAERVGADIVATDIAHALISVREMFGLDSVSMPLDVILHRVGDRVKALRSAHRWSQQELADAAGLDRTYLSGVERGRQNLTLGAMKKIADALGAPITDLMSV